MSSFDLISNIELEIAATVILHQYKEAFNIFFSPRTCLTNNLPHKSPTWSRQYFTSSVKESDMPLFVVNTYIRYRFARIDTSYRISSIIDVSPYSGSVMETQTSVRRKEIRVWHRITSTSDIKPVFGSDIYLAGYPCASGLIGSPDVSEIG